MKLVFVGGIFTDSQKELIESSSKGGIQYAAHAFQLNLLKGFDAVMDEGVEVVNLPFIGSFPSRFKRFYFPSCKLKMFSRTSVNGVGFINLTGLKMFFRFFSLLVELLRMPKANDLVFVIYSLHTPFIMAVFLARLFKHQRSKVCIVVPDLIEYMSDRRDFIYKVLRKVNLRIANFFYSRVDYYVLLTEAMSERLGVARDRFVVVEGVANDPGHERVERDTSKKVVFYSGTLAQRYGIRDLVDVFSELNDQSYELWICGDGDSKGYIEQASKRDPRIKYYGLIPRERVLDMQLHATILVNPRLPEGEYTKYSFPSKVMEYMASGRPLVMHRLPGIPKEYFDYCYTPSCSTKEGLKQCIEHVLSLDDDERDKVGVAAKKFVLDNKSYLAQATKIKHFLQEKLNAG